MLLALALLAGAAAFVIDCREAQPVVPEPDPLVRCDKAASCAYCSRNHWSITDFICCEDGTGWVSTHVYVPMIFYLHFQSPVLTLTLFTVFEAFEVFALVTTNSFVLFQTDELELETWAGSMFGDIMQGLVGLWLGVMLVYVFDLPSLVSTPWHMQKHDARGRRARYILVWAAASLSTIAVTWTNATDTLRYGLYTNIGVLLLLFWVLYPFFLYTSAENTMIWKSRLDGSIYPENWRKGFFFLSGAIILAIAASNFGWQYLPSDWYQVWLTEAVIGTALTIWALVVTVRRVDWYMLVVFICAWLLALVLALIVLSKVYDSSPTLWTALGMLLAVALTLVINEFAQSRAKPWDVGYSYRHRNTLTLEDAYKHNVE